MSSPKHDAVRRDIAMQLQASQNHREEEGCSTERHAFIRESPKRSHRDIKDNGGQCKSRSSSKAVWIVAFAICAALAVALGFLAGYFARHAATSRQTVEQSPESREAVHEKAVIGVSLDKIEEYNSLHTSHQCIIGKPSCSGNLTQVLAAQLSAMGFKVSTSTYNVLVSYPDMTRTSSLRAMDLQGHTLQVVALYGGDRAGPDYQLPPRGLRAAPRGTISSEDGDGDPAIRSNGGTSSSSPIYTPYSASGTARGEMVYANYGREADFTTIAEMGVDVSGKIALVRQGRDSTLNQASIAASHGISGLLMYPDPKDLTSDMPMDLPLTPDMSSMMGDPLTPGCPSVDGIYRSSLQSAGLPSIPVQPVSMATAAMLLSNLTGVPAVGSWAGGLNVTYHVGLRGQATQPWFLELDVHNDVIQKPIHDVVATIEGSQNPDQYVLLGGHYSSMLTSMISPGSSAAVMETARALGGLMEDGWTPRRTVMIGLWEGSEFGHIGSTEWAEENRMVLAERAVAYIDLTGGGDGTILNAQLSPMLKGIVMDAADRLGLTGMVDVGVLDGSGNHVPFSHVIGIPSAKIGIADSLASNSIVSPRASGRITRASSTQLATSVILSLADDEVLGLDAGSMADTLMTYTHNLDALIGGLMADDGTRMSVLMSAASEFASAVQDLQGVIGSDSIGNSPVTVTMVNSRLMYMERSFVDSGISNSVGSVLYGMQATDTFSTISGMIRNETGSVSMEMVQQALSRLQCTIQSATRAIAMSPS